MSQINKKPTDIEISWKYVNSKFLSIQYFDYMNHKCEILQREPKKKGYYTRKLNKKAEVIDGVYHCGDKLIFDENCPEILSDWNELDKSYDICDICHKFRRGKFIYSYVTICGSGECMSKLERYPNRYN